MQDEAWKLLLEKLDDYSRLLEKVRIADYVQLLERPRRLLMINFVAGVARGLGMAVGFTLIGALAIYLLKALVSLHLPVISNFIARIIIMVQEQYQLINL